MSYPIPSHLAFVNVAPHVCNFGPDGALVDSLAYIFDHVHFFSILLFNALFFPIATLASIPFILIPYLLYAALASTTLLRFGLPGLAPMDAVGFFLGCLMSLSVIPVYLDR